MLLLILLSPLQYGAWWIAFVTLVYGAARYSPGFCVALALLAVAAFICYYDYSWVQSEMAKPDWDGLPDFDIVFMIGVLIRIILVSIVLTVVAIIGRRLKKRSGSAVQSI